METPDDDGTGRSAGADGIVQDPDGAEGSERGGWFAPPGSPDRDAWVVVETAEAMAADALLFGRHSYEWFASRWADRPGAWADQLRSLPKYVVSSTMADDAATWGPTTVLRGDAVTEVTALKAERPGEIVVYASYRLGQALLERDLVDQLRLFVYPVILGDGVRLFGPTSVSKPVRLIESRTVGTNLSFLTYDVVRES